MHWIRGFSLSEPNHKVNSILVLECISIWCKEASIHQGAVGTSKRMKSLDLQVYTAGCADNFGAHCEKKKKICLLTVLGWSFVSHLFSYLVSSHISLTSAGYSYLLKKPQSHRSVHSCTFISANCIPDREVTPGNAGFSSE